MKKKIIIIVLVIANSVFAVLWQIARAEVNEARELADMNAAKAAMQAEMAMRNAQEAEHQKKRVDENAEIARMQMEEMTRQIAKLKGK